MKPTFDGWTLKKTLEKYIYNCSNCLTIWENHLQLAHTWHTKQTWLLQHTGGEMWQMWPKSLSRNESKGVENCCESSDELRKRQEAEQEATEVQILSFSLGRDQDGQEQGWGRQEGQNTLDILDMKPEGARLNSLDILGGTVNMLKFEMAGR